MFKVLLLLVSVSLSITQEDKSKENETVTKLDLSNKGLTSLNDYDFGIYPQLEELDLSNNLLEHIKEDKFTKNKHLKKLNLAGNTDLKLPDFSTLLIADIEELNLSDCNIEVLPPSVLDGLIKLKVIDLSENPLTSIKLITFTNLLSPEKIILPNLDDKKAITEICNELNITIEDLEQSVKCADIRKGNWDGIKKENSGAKDVPINLFQKEENTNLQKEPQIPVTEANATTENTNNSTDDTPKNDLPESPDVNDDLILMSDTEPDKLNTETNQQNDTETKNDKDVNNITAIVPKDSLIVPTQKLEEKINNTKEISPIETDKENQSNATVPESNAAANATLEQAIPIQRSILIPSLDQDKPKSEVPVTQIQPSKESGATVSKRLELQPTIEQVDLNSKIPNDNQTHPLKQDGSSAASTGAGAPPSTGTNILIFLVVAVIISGLAAFGYKFYKTRTYKPANTQEPIERELQEIVTDKSKRPDTNALEEQPLMNKNENNINNKEKTQTNDVNHTTVNSKQNVSPDAITSEKPNAIEK